MSREYIPHDYQLQIIDFIQKNPRCGIFASMGVGKSVSTLTALDQLSLVEDDIYPVLIIAPLRVARSTWPNEVKKWKSLNHLKVSVVTGSAAERLAALRRKADIYTINFDNMVWLVEALKGDWPFRTVVFDEFTRASGFRLRQGTKRARALGSIVHTLVHRFIGLTGTPAPNGLLGLWGMTWMLDQGERLGRTFSAYESRWFSKGFDGYSVKPLPHAQREIEAKLSDICVTVEGLPVDEPIFNTIEVELPPAARKLYSEMEKALFIEIAQKGVEAVNAASKTVKLLQLASGFIYTDENGAWEQVHDATLEAMDSIIEEAAGAPVLISYDFKADLERLKKRYPKGRVLDTNPKTIDDWNAGKIELLFAHPASAGHGISLAEGGNIIAFLTRGWNLELFMQILERLGPQRQKQAGLDRPVFVHFIVPKNTIVELVGERLTSKRSVQDTLLDALRQREELAA